MIDKAIIVENKLKEMEMASGRCHIKDNLQQATLGLTYLILALSSENHR
jgi:hypothetical protein